MNDGMAVVLHSGGQDSSTCLAWAVHRWGADRVFPVSFHYGQKHAVELQCAQEICARLEVRMPNRLPVEALSILGGAALTDPDNVQVSADPAGTGNLYAEAHGLPSTFVPGRNLLFFTLAAAYAAKHGIRNIVTGVCEADDAGYPDCRGSFVRAAETAISEALDERIAIHAPLLDKSKAETFALASSLGVLDLIVESTHTCYNGVHDAAHKHDWGYGCGQCPACEERKKGWEQYKGVPA